MLLAGAAVCLSLKPATWFATVQSAAVAMAFASAVIYLALLPALRPAFDLKPLATYVSSLQRQGDRLAWSGKYHGQLQFSGRLEQRIEPLTDAGAVQRWMADHPHGYLIENRRSMPSALPGEVFVQPYRSGYLLVWPVADRIHR